MNDEQIEKIITKTVATTVQHLKVAGLLRDDTQSAYKKTEALLRQYPQLKEVQEPYARRVVQAIDACLEEVANEPYADVIRLYYFEGMKNAACASALFCGERTCRRNRKNLVERFSARLASDVFLQELLG